MNVRLIGLTKPLIEEVSTAGELITFCGRVSSPHNQLNFETSPRLLRYLIRNGHWSPFEMVHAVMEINTTRDIARQILRHRSFSFQEFSGRYAEMPTEPVYREARLQDTKNRQNSIELPADSGHHGEWKKDQDQVWALAVANYRYALQRGIAKEVARALLPEGLVRSRLYMSGTLRSWLHYIQVRTDPSTQKEHRDIARECAKILEREFPELDGLLAPEESTKS